MVIQFKFWEWILLSKSYKNSSTGLSKTTLISLRGINMSSLLSLQDICFIKNIFERVLSLFNFQKKCKMFFSKFLETLILSEIVVTDVVVISGFTRPPLTRGPVRQWRQFEASFIKDRWRPKFYRSRWQIKFWMAGKRLRSTCLFLKFWGFLEIKMKRKNIWLGVIEKIDLIQHSTLKTK